MDSLDVLINASKFYDFFEEVINGSHPDFDIRDTFIVYRGQRFNYFDDYQLFEFILYCYCKCYKDGD